MLDLDGARRALRAHTPAALLNLPEGQWLDAKAEAYELKNPRGVEELAKDTAAFANGGGGLIVIGIRTRHVDGNEVLDRIEALNRQVVNLGQIRQLLHDRITPPPRGVTVDWSDDQQGSCVAYIDIPEQAPNCLFVVAAPVGKPGSPRTDTAAVPIRDGDGTRWLPRTEIQRLLAAGIAATGLPTGQALTELIRETIAETRPPAGPAEPHVGQGLSDRARELRQAYEQLRGTGLGQPAGEAYMCGAAAVQDFHATADGQPDWVLCLVHGRPPVAVPATIWQALTEAGQPDPSGDRLATVGYPTPCAPDQDPTSAPWAVDPDAQRIELGGGIWGPGLLLRSGRGQWRWQPATRWDFTQTRAALNWTAHQPPPQLRIRALVTLPWTHPSTLQITPQRRRHLEQTLPYSALAGAVTLLSRHRGTELPAAQWDTGPYTNTPGAASYTSTITAPDGRPAITAAVQIALPTTTDSTVVTCADVLLQDTAAWAAAFPDHATTQLTLDEVQHLLLTAWETAAELLPDTTGADPTTLRWAAPPTTELRLSTEGPHDHPTPDLDQLIDLSPLGPTDRDVLPQLSVTITTTPTMERRQRQVLLRQALADTAQHFGYLQADPELL